MVFIMDPEMLLTVDRCVRLHIPGSEGMERAVI